MKPLFALILALAATFAQGQTMGLHLGSIHDKRGFNNTNPGLYLKTESGLTIGAVVNSENNPAFYMGKTYAKPLAFGDLSVTVGGIYGYALAPIVPLAVPSLGLVCGEKTTCRISFLAQLHKNGANALHFSIEKRL
jgi:hypothetical protein